MLNERVTASSSTTKVLKLRLEEDTVTITKMELMELARNSEGGESTGCVRGCGCWRRR
jgi:hypothetical protein